MWFRNFGLIVGHPGSVTGPLIQSLSRSDRFLHVPAPGVIDHPDKVQALVAGPHKVSHAGAVFALDLLTNPQLTWPRLVECCRTAFVLSDPRRAIPRLVAAGITEDAAVRCYTFRLRRIAELGKRAASGAVVTEAELETPEGVGLVAGLFRLRDVIEPVRVPAPDWDIDHRLMGWAVESYEKYLSYLRGLSLRRIA